MKTVADLKRTLKVGMRFHAYHHGGVVTCPQAKDMGIRTISKINSTGIEFTTENNQTSYLDWPKAKDFKPHENGKDWDILKSQLGGDNTPLLTYKML